MTVWFIELNLAYVKPVLPVLYDSQHFVCSENSLLFVAEEICGYTIYKTLSDLPFRIVEVDRISGSGQIVLVPGAVLDYERVHQYSFEIAAHDCESGNHAQR